MGLRLLSKIYSKLVSLDNKLVKQLLQFDDGTVLINPRFFKKSYDGNGFSVSHRFPAVASGGGTATFYFENPSTNDKTAYIVIVEVVSTAQGWIDIYRDNTGVSGGTQKTPVNLNLGSSNTSNIIAIADPATITLGTKAHETVAPGGTGIRAIGSASEVGEAIIIPPGKNIAVVVTNQSSTTTADISIRMIWWEE